MYYKFWENRGFGGGTPIGANLLKQYSGGGLE